MSKAFIYIYMSVVVGANLIFGLVLPIHREAQDLPSSAFEWNLPSLHRTVSPDAKELLATGFWGKVDFVLDQSAEDATPKEIAAEEAKQLRAQVKAIINRDHSKEVIFVVGKIYHRINLGGLLPGTQWILMDAGEDWLKLSKDGALDNIETLKLFAGADAGSSIEAEK